MHLLTDADSSTDTKTNPARKAKFVKNIYIFFFYSGLIRLIGCLIGIIGGLIGGLIGDVICGLIGLIGGLISLIGGPIGIFGG